MDGGITEIDRRSGFIDRRCPYDRSDQAARREIRQRLRDLGYDRIIAVHSAYSLKAVDAITGQDGRGKKPGREPVLDASGNKKFGPDGDLVFTNWREVGHSEWFQNRATHALGNTGVVLGGRHNLIAIDIDSNKKTSLAEREAFGLDAFRELIKGVLGLSIRQAPIRLRFPGSIAIIMRSDRPMTKRKIIGERGAVELLAEGQQIVVHGDHRDVIEHGQAGNWRWRNNHAPWTQPVTDVPVVAVASVEAEINRLKRLDVLGSPVTSSSGVGGNGGHGGGNSRSTRYPATDKLNELFRRHSGLVKPAVCELIAGTVEGERHDTIVAVCGSLAFRNWTEQQIVDLLMPAISANPQFMGFDAAEEIQKAFGHARGKDLARFARAKGYTWLK